MKIAYLSYSYFADTDFSIVRELSKKADLYYFIIITPLSLRTTMINIQKQYPVSGIFKASIYPEIENLGIFDKEKTYIVNICNRRICFKNFCVFAKLLFLLIRLNIKVLHTTMFYSATMFLLYFLHRKTFLTVHDPLPHSDVRSKRDFIYRKIAFYFIRNFIILNKTQKDEFVSRYKLQHKNIYISHLGIYDYLCRYTNVMLPGSKERYILFFGRITLYKGLDYLFPAMKILHKTHENVKLIAAGYCEKYYFDISEYQDCSYIEIINRFIPDSELAVLIQNALFVVCPYIDATQSGVVMSAFAFNVPVLATNVGGLSEYVEHMKSGYIVPPKDINELADGMKFLLDHNELLDEQRRYIDGKYKTGDYSWDKITDDLIEIYKHK